MSIKFNLIAAACENMGIGKNNDLPWRLKSEMAYFTKMTSTTTDSRKKNVVIMGRKTWDSIPPKFKPLSDRINFVLSKSQLDLNQYKDVYGFTSWKEIQDRLNDNKFKDVYEIVWVVGGSRIYKEAMESKYFYRLYLTEIKKEFDCDTFFPKLGANLKQISDPDVPEEVQKEKGIEFQYKVYENNEYKEE
ncbi:hypothetical protein ILUMI_00808 [Ignelater luminosus]|uniref:dihydrofolate reductase n=1 Tax=Ignelater luminosus TaxID=2038154 RepID=A0A8K0DJN9_IGNLU|nr:hypothetical protein ILUMI_00808 [Ignelater luminosus]